MTGGRGLSDSGGSSGIRSSASIAFRTGFAADLSRECSIVTLKPYFSAIFVATSGSTRWLMDARILSAIRSAISLFGLMLSLAARSLTTTAPRMEISRSASLTLMRLVGGGTGPAATAAFGTRLSNAFCPSRPFLSLRLPRSPSS